MKENFTVDVVIPWVDGSDPKWMAEKEKYMEGIKKNEGNGASRYRDWGILKYLFRSLEINVPWVNKIHFVTCGHYPSWLALDNPKISFVTHKDFIPLCYLPTFSINPIELNIHRIPNLAEHFIYMNDDTFIMEPIDRDFYFADNGLPRQMLRVMCVDNYAPNTDITYLEYNNMGLINRNFSIRSFPITKLFHYSYGLKINIRNLVLPLSYVYPGFGQFHMPAPFLKSTFIEAWDKEYEYLDQVCCHKFRHYKDVNQWLLQYWQLVTGHFESINMLKHCKLFEIGVDDREMYSALYRHRYKVVCLNDSDTNIDFETEKHKLTEALEKLYPNKSSFEN